MRGYRPTWAEVNLSNIRYNFHQVKKLIRPGVKVMVTVKADAYGHGLVPVARTLTDAGVDLLGVASIDEGIYLREAGIGVPILILGVVLPDSLDPLWQYQLTPTVCTRECCVALAAKARRFGAPIAVHVKVDSGMGRIGVAGSEALRFINALRNLRGITIEGIFTHFAKADCDAAFTRRQMKIFSDIVRSLATQGVTIPLVHAANSMGVIAFPEAHATLVRPGLMIYGLYPTGDCGINLKPALSLKTRIVFAKRVSSGTGVSYGHRYVTKRPTTIVTIPLGYGDGYPRNLSNRAPVLINGKRFTISGTVCMDQIMVDVGRARVSVGDEVVLIGVQKGARITAEELARLAGTIPYEIVCGLGSRVPRVYV